MVNDLIKKMFEARNEAHLEHWRTKSFAQHAALGEYYDEVVDTVDKFVEAYQGTFGIVETGKKDVAKIIHDDIIWLNDNREKLCKGVSALENIIDELTALHMKTLYKLENLR